MKRAQVIAIAGVAIILCVTALSLRGRRQSSAPQIAEATDAPNAQQAAPGTTTLRPSESAEPERMSPEQFAARLKQTLEELPTVEQLRELSEEELHGTPTLIIEGGVKLGEVAQAVHDQPELRDAAHEFYARCAQDTKLASAIRSVCSSHLVHE